MMTPPQIAHPAPYATPAVRARRDALSRSAACAITRSRSDVVFYGVNIVSGDYEAIHLGSALSKVAWITKTILPNNAGVCRHQDIHCQPSLFSLQLLSDPTDLAYLTLYLLEEANNKIL